MQLLLAYLLGGLHSIQAKTGQIYIFYNQKSLLGAFVAVLFK